MVDRWSNPQKYGVTNVQIEAEGEMKEKGGGRSQAEEMKGRRQLGYSFFFLKTILLRNITSVHFGDLLDYSLMVGT